MATKKADAVLEVQDWNRLNDTLRSCDEDLARQLLESERRGKRRVQWLMRIHGRYNKLRAQRERQELLTQQG